VGRYRALRKPSSKYITPEGKKHPDKALRYLWKVKRPAVTQSVSEEVAQSDHSENVEYEHYVLLKLDLVVKNTSMLRP
jgi:transcription elongation factor GreB